MSSAVVATSLCCPTAFQQNCNITYWLSCLVQVYVHFSVINADDDLLYTSWAEEGGSGQPLAFVIGKGSRAPRAWELAVLGKQQGSQLLLLLNLENSQVITADALCCFGS